MKAITRSLPFALAYVVPLFCLLALKYGGFALLGPPLFLFVITPIIDELVGRFTAELEDDAAASKWRDLRYDLWLWLWLPVQLALQVGLLRAAAAAAPLELVGYAFASGFLGALGINVAHEFMHRKGKPERALAEVLLTSVSYAHFSVEHVLGHHRDVATPSDAASARAGENIVQFWWRSITWSARHAWQLEGDRVQKLSIPFGLRDRRVRYPLAWLALVACVLALLGPVGLIAFLLQSLFAILLLETINYVEHYGLARHADEDGKWERVMPAHSWSSAHRLTGLQLFNLTRHADHHANASRPFFALRHLEEGPKLPFGYGTMIVLALVPPVWRRVMDPRVEELRAA